MALVPPVEWRSARRHRWLDKRARNGKKRPRPLVTMTVNCMSISTGHQHAAQILRNAAAWVTPHGIPDVPPGLPVDVLLGSECDDFDGNHVLGIEWDTLHDADNGDRDGTMLAIRATRGRLANPHYKFAARALFGAMADRYLAVARLLIDEKTPYFWNPKAAASHGPPKRGWLRWLPYMARVRSTKADFIGGDWNKLARAVMPATRRRTSMVHILGLASRWWIPVSDPIPVDVGGDHRAVVVVLWPNPKENR